MIDLIPLYPQWYIAVTYNAITYGYFGEYR
jgi:hypothetical protein